MRAVHFPGLLGRKKTEQEHDEHQVQNHDLRKYP